MPIGRLHGIGPPRMRKPSGLGVEPLCISDRQRLRQIRDWFGPTMVIHAAGVCDLDVCEERPGWARRINAEGTCAIADTFSRSSHIIYLSTDLVFSGNNPPETGYAEHHLPDPVSVAGESFLKGEQSVRSADQWSIIRLGLPVGKSVTGDKGGLDWIEGRLKRNLPVTLFTDEYRSIISCRDVARCVLEYAASGISGLFHLGGNTTVSLFGLGSMIIRGGGYTPGLLNGITRHEERNGPPRIGNVTLNSSKITPLLSEPPGAWGYSLVTG